MLGLRYAAAGLSAGSRNAGLAVRLLYGRSFLGRNFFHHSSRHPLTFQTLLLQKRFQSTVSQHLQDPTSTTSTATTSTPLPPPPSRLRRLLTTLLLFLVFTTAGLAMSAAPAIRTANALLTPPTDAETLRLFRPSTPTESDTEEHINSHPLARHLRASTHPPYAESRPHMKIPAAMRPHNFTGGTLLGADKIPVPPLVFHTLPPSPASSSSSTSFLPELVSIQYLGPALCGHPGLVHGGLLATLLDEGLARCCFPALPSKVGVTASLKVDYKAPCRAETYVVLKARTTRVEGRKAWVEGRLETLVGAEEWARGVRPVTLVEASALFIEPRGAGAMARLYSD